MHRPTTPAVDPATTGTRPSGLPAAAPALRPRRKEHHIGAAEARRDLARERHAGEGDPVPRKVAPALERGRRAHRRSPSAGRSATPRRLDARARVSAGSGAVTTAPVPSRPGSRGIDGSAGCARRRPLSGGRLDHLGEGLDTWYGVAGGGRRAPAAGAGAFWAPAVVPCSVTRGRPRAPRAPGIHKWACTTASPSAHSARPGALAEALMVAQRLRPLAERPRPASGRCRPGSPVRGTSTAPAHRTPSSASRPPCPVRRGDDADVVARRAAHGEADAGGPRQVAAYRGSCGCENDPHG